MERRFIPARAGNGPERADPKSTTSVHPRARGERDASPAGTPRNAGSSPRARGTDPVARGVDADERFIPARAGNGSASAAAPTPPPVHPRARGERCRSTAATKSASGSSPRARGTAGCPSPFRLHRRFIPARAGNGRAALDRAACPTVHPRARGERFHVRSVHSILLGSSPRARGTVTKPPHATGFRRFIPARAGNGTVWSRRCSTCAVHPRARGERTRSASLFPA